MKKTILILTMLLLAITFSCGSDDDSNSNSTFEVNGTSWRGTGETNTARTITFTSSTEYTYTEPGATIDGTYTYNSSSKEGTLNDEFGNLPFSVNNSLLTIDYDYSTGSAYEDTTGVETFVQQ